MASDEAKPERKPLAVRLIKSGTEYFRGTFDQTLEVGRQREGDPVSPAIVTTDGDTVRLIIADLDARKIPRQLLTVSRSAKRGVRIGNIHSTIEFQVRSKGTLKPKQICLASLPAVLYLPSGIKLECAHSFTDPEPAQTTGSETESAFISKMRLPTEELASLQELHDALDGDATVSLPELPFLQSRETPVPNADLEQHWGHSEADLFLHWLDLVMVSLQRSVRNPLFFRGIAETAVRILGLDRAEIVLLRNDKWDFDASRGFTIDSERREKQNNPSKSILNKVRELREIVVLPDQSASTDLIASSDIDPASRIIAAPIVDEQGEVIGVLYADRQRPPEDSARSSAAIEERLFEILVTGISAGIARSKREEQLTKYQQYFSPKVIDAIRKEPKLLDGEDREVTVLFCDVQQFSQIASRVGCERTMHWIQDLFTELSQSVIDTDGVLVDYIGDQIFAMWGAPDRSSDYALRAVRACHRMLRSKSKLNERWREQLGGPFSFSMGICTGIARVGNTGSAQKYQYGALGSTINVCSRIQGLTKYWRTAALVDRATADRTAKEFPVRRLSKVQLIGIEEAVDLFEVSFDHSNTTLALHDAYTEALERFESGDYRKAARDFGNLVERYPDDGPSLIMLSRASQALVNPDGQNAIWISPSK